MRGSAVSRRYIEVCYCDTFSGVFFFVYRKNLLQEIQQKRSSHLYNIYNLPFSID